MLSFPPLPTRGGSTTWDLTRRADHILYRAFDRCSGPSTSYTRVACISGYNALLYEYHTIHTTSFASSSHCTSCLRSLSLTSLCSADVRSVSGSWFSVPFSTLFPFSLFHVPFPPPPPVAIEKKTRSGIHSCRRSNEMQGPTVPYRQSFSFM